MNDQTAAPAIPLAGSLILVDLVNALLAEGLLSESGKGKIATTDKLPPVLAAGLRNETRKSGKTTTEELVFLRQVGGHRPCELIIPVEQSLNTPYRMRGNAIWLRSAGDYDGKAVREAELETFLEALAGCWEEPDTGKKIYDYKRLFGELRQAAGHLALTLESNTVPAPGFPASLQELERYAAVRDRPFHPAAKAKNGWNEDEYVRYSAEFGRSFPLYWVAVRRDLLLSGIGSEGADPSDILLDADRAAIVQAYERLGLHRDRYAALPVHPWQLKRVLPRELGAEMAEGVCVPLGVETGNYAATSSARSLAPSGGGCSHVKLPLGIVSLGAVRSLPALYMTNGERAQALLLELKNRDEWLGNRLHLCDESAWWAYMPEAGDWFDDRPRHLSCQLRRYPTPLLEEERYQLVPMSAFAVNTAGSHLFDAWLKLREMDCSESAVIRLFCELCDEFLQLCLRMLSYGVLPEIHGQNVLIVLENGIPAGLLLRDHDTVRLYRPWMERRRLSDPGFIVKPGRQNSLYNATPEQLLFYLQTLGIQVNLYSIADSLAKRYDMSENGLWHVMENSLKRAIECAGWTADARRTVEETMFEKETWPWKQIITPLLVQKGLPGGSMPSATGSVPNPFVRLRKGGFIL